MTTKSTPISVPLEQLILDKDNPRFAELYSGSDSEEEIIEYLLYTESADEVARAISEADEYYPDRPLWVIRDGENYLVKDGNRRCASVKALNIPSKYGLPLPKIDLVELPALLYHDVNDLNDRIRQEHTSSLFKQWGRIAKALEIYRLFSSGSSIESLTDLDSSPKEFIKLASFYYAAVAIRGEDFKMLLRTGRGKTGGKTIVFERMFRSRNECGYTFKSRSTNEIDIKDEGLFEAYVSAMVDYILADPEKITSRYIDDVGPSAVLEELKPFGFPPELEKEDELEAGDSTDQGSDSSENSEGESQSSTEEGENTGGNNSNGSGTGSSGGTGGGARHSVKNKPTLKRKGIPAQLMGLIKECYSLDQNNFANAKTALTRVTLECTLKYVVENTKKPNGNPIKTANHFDSAFRDRRGNQLIYTNFDVLKAKFSELILDTGIRKAFEDFDIQNPHQIIHNYHVVAVPANAKALCDNLIDLLEFMLQEENDLINSLDSSKF